MDLDAAEVGCWAADREAAHDTDVYPLSLNGLRTACNQSTNRDPVVSYDDDTIRDALHRLGRRRWTRLASGARAAEYRHLLDEEPGLARDEQAVLAVLMLRGPQTPGELRTRAERMQRSPTPPSCVSARPAGRARVRRAAAAPARPEGGALRAPAHERPRGREPAPAPAATSVAASQRHAPRPRPTPRADPLAERLDRLRASQRSPPRSRQLRAALGGRPQRGGTYGAASTVPWARSRSAGRPRRAAPACCAGRPAGPAPASPRARRHRRPATRGGPSALVIEYEQSHEVRVRAQGSGTSRIMIRFVPPAIPARPAVITTLAPGASSAKSRAPSRAASISSSTVSAWSMRVA